MSLFARSLLVLALLFGLVFAVGAGVLYYQHVPVIYAIFLAVAIVVLQYAISPYLIGWIYKIRWTVPEEISPEFANYLRTLCAKRRIPVPRFGIIEDGNPNAFTYGHIPSDARLVVTRGVQQMLTPEEFNAVVAHEVGHITHYDFIVMTVAAVVPMVLYLLYVWTRGRRGGGAALLVSIGAYVTYFISQYIVLFLSRIREYFADQDAAYAVDSANAIATALVKIAYGLARIPQQADGAKQNTAMQPSKLMGSLGICSFSSASTLALYATSPNRTFSTTAMLKAMQWDLWNPWARFFEIQSTHPLVARRVQAASRIAELRNEQPTFPTSMQPVGGYRREFVMDLFFLCLPYTGIVMTIVGITRLILHNGAQNMVSDDGMSLYAMKALSLLGIGLLLAGIGWMLRLVYSYGSPFKPWKVEDLVGEVAVSHIRCIPVELRGEIIGRGVPGLFWSKDLVMQDETGFIPLIYKQPLGIIETIFGVLRAEKLVGKSGVFRGWYRRGPSPYLELKDARFSDGDTTACYYISYLWIGAAICTIAGALIMFVAKR